MSDPSETVGSPAAAALPARLAERALAGLRAASTQHAALLEDGGEPAVYVVRDGKAQRTVLKLGYNDAGWVEVREGLKPGDQVVIAGKAALREGSAVQVIGQDKKPATVAKAPAAEASKQ